MADLKKSEQEIRHYTPAGGVIEKKGAYKDFMCDCKDDGKKRCQEVLDQVCEELKCEPDEIVTSVVMSLTWGLNHPVSITGVPWDMWGAVCAESDTDSFFIQCDKAEYGFARLWQMAKEVDEEKEPD